MKHGPIALIDEMMPVVFIAPHDSVFDKVVSNVQEVKARKGRVIAITSRDEPALDGKIDYEFRIPETIDMLDADSRVDPAAAARVLHRGEARLERRSAAEPREVGDGGVAPRRRGKTEGTSLYKCRPSPRVNHDARGRVILDRCLTAWSRSTRCRSRRS